MKAILLSLLAILPLPLQAVAETKPNIIWFVVDDMSANLSCYGETKISTPNLDRLAAQGTKFTRAYATSPVCSTFRSSLITGMYQTSIGSHHHRSGRSEKHPIILPPDVHPVPVLFKQHGYHTCNGSGLLNLDFRTQAKTSRTQSRLGKTDYNFTWDPSMYDSNDWSDRDPGQPFFMQVQLHGGKLRGASDAQYNSFTKQVINLLGEATSPEEIDLPPHYPDDAILRQDWSTYLDSVRVTDHHVGLVIERLRQEKLLDNTLLIFFTDHGISHARGKQFLYDEGTHIPLIIAGPSITPGKIRTDLVEHIDIAALTLAAAGIEKPESMQGQNILDPSHQPKDAVYAARDRCGEAADRIRSVRTENYLYIKNFFPDRPLLMPSSYKDGKLILQRLRELKAADQLSDLTNALLFSPTRAAEELYLYKSDRWQLVNLAESAEHQPALMEHRGRLENWIKTSNDHGEESIETYLIEVEDQIESTRSEVTKSIYRHNVQIYLDWIKNGK